MERLTEKHYGKDEYFMKCSAACQKDDDEPCILCPELDKIVDRLATYENTGLTPEQVETMKTERNALLEFASGKVVAELVELDGVKIEVVRDLLRAVSEELVIPVPAKVGSTIYLIREADRKNRGECRFCVDEYRIDHFTIGDTMIPMITACSPDNKWEELIDCTQIGHEYWLSKEEAEVALAKDINVPCESEG